MLNRLKKRRYSFTNAQKEWQNVPLDNIGYFNSKDLLALNDKEFLRIINASIQNRYSTNDYRNYGNKWKIYSGMETTKRKVIMDFGCGAGIESLQFAKNGNSVIIADINPYNLQVADRLLKLHGFTPHEVIQITESNPFFTLENTKIDIFYANGVLHHTPYIREILSRALTILSDDGIARLMLYSDRGYLKYIDSDLPDFTEDIRESKNFKKMYTHFDSVGKYADWYSEKKIAFRVSGLYKVRNFNYITDDDRFCFVDLEKL